MAHLAWSRFPFCLQDEGRRRMRPHQKMVCFILLGAGLDMHFFLLGIGCSFKERNNPILDITRIAMCVWVMGTIHVMSLVHDLTGE